MRFAGPVRNVDQIPDALLGAFIFRVTRGAAFFFTPRGVAFFATRDVLRTAAIFFPTFRFAAGRFFAFTIAPPRFTLKLRF